MNALNTATIYKICSTNTNLVYIGSTKMDLFKRYKLHKNAYRSYLKHKTGYYTAFDIFDTGIEFLRIELIEDFQYTNNKEILDRERHHIMNNFSVNKYLPNRSYRQYCKDNREIMKLKKHKYYEDNKDRFKQRYEDNKHKKNLDININVNINIINK